MKHATPIRDTRHTSALAFAARRPRAPHANKVRPFNPAGLASIIPPTVAIVGPDVLYRMIMRTGVKRRDVTHAAVDAVCVVLDHMFGIEFADACYSCNGSGGAGNVAVALALRFNAPLEVYLPAYVDKGGGSGQPPRGLAHTAEGRNGPAYAHAGGSLARSHSMHDMASGSPLGTSITRMLRTASMPNSILLEPIGDRACTEAAAYGEANADIVCDCAVLIAFTSNGTYSSMDRHTRDAWKRAEKAEKCRYMIPVERMRALTHSA